MKTWFAKLLRRLVLATSLLLFAAAGLAGWFYLQLQASLPQLDGETKLPGLATPVTIERDALGIPTLHGKTRADVARALGFLHAQERFFQMDLMRRKAAGELSELFGPRTVDRDRAVRLHGFRALARQAVTLDRAENRAVVTAYTEGVNAGLSALRRPPFEYLVLRSEPQPWLPEDSYLIGYAMALNLQESDGRYERSLAALRNHYGPEVAAFFAPLQTSADAALDGSTAVLPPVPTARQINLRRRLSAPVQPTVTEDPALPGSNSFALAGSRTAAGGAALLANDMHLDHGMPNTWYRASLVWADRRVTGLTLPGTPAMIVGSNGRVAWGFTNSYADASDVIMVDLNTISSALYRHGTENLDFIHRREVIRVKGEKDVELDVRSTHWGPIIGTGEKERPYAYRWVMHEPGAINFALLDMEHANTVAEGIAVAHRAGLPAQNILLADTVGDIAWTIAGALPKRVGYDGRLPVAWTYDDRHWEGLLPAAETPVVLTPASGQLWSANQRMMGGEALTRLGDGGYAAPDRAARIRDRLSHLTAATPADLLAIQLDEAAPLLTRWHELLQRILSAKTDPERTALRTASATWEGRATVDSTSYRLVRAFRQQVAQRVLTPVFTSASRHEPLLIFNWRRFHYEEPLWTLLQEQPAHLLNPEFETWDELLLASADAVLAELDQAGLSPDKATWGRRNRAHIRHPLGHFLPRWTTRWLDIAADPLPGDTHTPRVQAPHHGASNRLVVAPGREHEGILHLPGGQSGHPLSPFYRAGHDAWVRGEPTPFLPGPAQHTLTLVP